jgi:hypothetical protein
MSESRGFCRVQSHISVNKNRMTRSDAAPTFSSGQAGPPFFPRIRLSLVSSLDCMQGRQRVFSQIHACFCEKPTETYVARRAAGRPEDRRLSLRERAFFDGATHDGETPVEWACRRSSRPERAQTNQPRAKRRGDSRQRRPGDADSTGHTALKGRNKIFVRRRARSDPQWGR